MRVATSTISDILHMAAARTRAVEGAGYDMVLTVENQHELFLPLAASVTTTERVRRMIHDEAKLVKFVRTGDC